MGQFRRSRETGGSFEDHRKSRGRDFGKKGSRRSRGRDSDREGSRGRSFDRGSRRDSDRSSRRDSDRGSRRGGSNRDSRRGRLEMTKVICSACGNECEVPFKPTTDKPLFCSDCYEKEEGKSNRRSNNRSSNGPTSKDLDMINEKLNKIMKALKID